MAIDNINSSISSSDVQTITALTTPSTTTAAAAVAQPGVSVDISKPGQLLSQLTSLAQSDPDKFKAVTADIAQKLGDAAASQTGRAGDFLKSLADRFSAASQSGDASGLAPQGGAGRAHHHGRHHHGGAGGAGGGSAVSAGGSNDSLAQQIEGIISGALEGDGTTG
jgi:hypothetical protein